MWIGRILDDKTIYIYNIQTIKPSAIEFAKTIVRACELMDEFENFKRSKKIRQLIIDLNDVEEVCDKLYLSSMRELTTSGNVLELKTLICGI